MNKLFDILVNNKKKIMKDLNNFILCVVKLDIWLEKNADNKTIKVDSLLPEI